MTVVRRYVYRHNGRYILSRRIKQGDILIIERRVLTDLGDEVLLRCKNVLTRA